MSCTVQYLSQDPRNLCERGLLRVLANMQGHANIRLQCDANVDEDAVLSAYDFRPPVMMGQDFGLDVSVRLGSGMTLADAACELALAYAEWRSTLTLPSNH